MLSFIVETNVRITFTNALLYAACLKSTPPEGRLRHRNITNHILLNKAQVCLILFLNICFCSFTNLLKIIFI